MNQDVQSQPAQGQDENRAPAEDTPIHHTPSLKKLAIQGSAWVIAGYGFGQAARFAGNVILARLLYPEAFGMMLNLNIIIQGLHMCLDFSIGPSIVNSRRGNEPDFLHTAWTLQAARGFVLWLIAAAAAIPVARFYGHPEMALLLIVLAFTSVINGFHSTVLPTLDKNLRAGKLIRIEIGTQILGLLVTIVVSYFYRSVWSLLVGSYVTALVKLVISHRVNPAIPMRFRWSSESRRELVHFGKWLLLSSILTYLIRNGTPLLLGKTLQIAAVGVYSIAFNLAQSPLEIVSKLSNKILFPVYSKLATERPHELHRKTFRARLGALGISVPILCVLAVFGPTIINLLYDNRYSDAEWMLPLCAGSVIIPAITSTIIPVLLAVGDSFGYMLLLTCRAFFLVICMWAGQRYYGTTGVILSVPASELLSYPILAMCVHKYRVWQPLADLGFVAVPFAVIALGVGAHHFGWF